MARASGVAGDPTRPRAHCRQHLLFTRGISSRRNRPCLPCVLLALTQLLLELENVRVKHRVRFGSICDRLLGERLDRLPLGPVREPEPGRGGRYSRLRLD